MGDVPDAVRALVEEREAARRRKDFSAADRLRDLVRETGFEIVDGPGGPEVRPGERTGPSPKPAPGRTVQAKSSEDVESLLDRPPSADVSVQWVVQGWPEDVARGIESFQRHTGPSTSRHVVVDAAGLLGDFTWPGEVDVVDVAPEAGWAAARNAGLRRAAGRVVVLVDGSVEAEGDVLGPLVEALEDPSVGVAGPFGIVSDDLREFRDSEGPDVDAVEGYVIAFRRELVEGGLRFDEKFRFYRSADIEFSFQVKAKGLRAVVVPLPLARHEHRMWTNTPEDERARLSKRNFYRFLERWRGRTDLLVSREGEGKG